MNGSLARLLTRMACALVALGLVALSAGSATGSRAAGPGAIQTPVLKWQHGGCTSWCETGWYSSPAVADLDGDGSAEVIASAYSIWALDGKTGAVKWKTASGYDRSSPGASSVGRTWPGIVAADVDGDGQIEIVTAHGGGYVSVYTSAGYFKSGWPQRPISNELRGLAVFDLDGDGKLEIVVTGALSGRTNTWVYAYNGTLLAGWPQLANDSGYAAGVYNANTALGDLDSDGQGEIVVPSDVHYICAYERDGVQIPANAMYGAKGWGKVGVWESLAVELRGWGTCDGSDPRSERYRPNFAHSPALIADVNRDGTPEVVATGNVYDCIPGYPSQYEGVYIFNADRSRFHAGSYDWSSPPVDTGAPLSEDYDEIENVQPNPAVADLDGDGNLEILYASYDGRLHAFWLDRTEHGNWPYSAYDPSEGFYRFASEPAVADLDRDGHAEVIFTSWTQKGSSRTGKLTILDYLGNVLQSVDLPPAMGSSNWNGALAAPTLDNLDDDADLEVVINTAHSGVVAYDLPGTAGARVLWGTGRGNYQRSGSILHGTLEPSYMAAQPVRPAPTDDVSFTITLINPGPLVPGARVTSTIPAGASYQPGSLWASAGSYGRAGSLITWTGNVPAGTPIQIRFVVVSSPVITSPHSLTSNAQIDAGLGQIWTRQASAVINGYGVYLPVISKR